MSRYPWVAKRFLTPEQRNVIEEVSYAWMLFPDERERVMRWYMGGASLTVLTRLNDRERAALRDIDRKLGHDPAKGVSYE